MTTKVSELRAQIQELEGKLEGLKQEQATSQEQLTKLETERKSYVIAARLEKNTAAQKNMQRLDAEMDKLQRSIRDDGYVVEELTKALDGFKEDLAAAEWEARCEQVRRLIDARKKSNGDRRLVELVQQLDQLLGELTASESQIAEAMRQLDPGLVNESRRVVKDEDRRHYIAIRLGVDGPQIVNSDIRRRIANSDPASMQDLDAALSALDYLQPQCA